MSTELVSIKLDTDILAIIKTGDLGRLSEQQQLQYYIYECNRIGLDPASRPFAWLRLNGKLVLYADRRCGDMLATKHGFTTEIVEGPCIKEFGTVSVLYCRARARGTNGRSVEDVGTLATSDIVNGVMKVLSKAVRRATLRLAGWGGLDEAELETIPEHTKSLTDSAPTETEPPDYDPSLDAAFDKFHAAVQCIEMPYEAVLLWIKYRSEIAGMPSAVRKEAWRILYNRVEDVGKMASGEGHGWLRANISAEGTRNAATIPDQTDRDIVRKRLDERYEVPQSVRDIAAQYNLPLPLTVASAIWHDHALNGTLWSTEERDATFAFLMDRARVSHRELDRAISIEQWARDVKEAPDTDELRDIYVAAQNSVRSPPWNEETGPAALKDLASLCAERKSRLVSLEPSPENVSVGARDASAILTDTVHSIEPTRSQAAVADDTEAQREMTVEQWARDVQAARSVDELRDIYAEAQVAIGLPPWGSETGLAALKNISSLCTERKAKLTLPELSIEELEHSHQKLIQGFAKRTSEEERFTAYVMSQTDRFELERGIEKHLSEYDLSADTIVRIAAPRLVELASSTKYSLTSMQAVNTIRALANGTHRARREG